MKNNEKNFKEIQNHLKATGFVYQGSEIYGGLSNTWDYGHLGVELKRNIKNKWWSEFITKEQNNYGLDSKILMHSSVWEASGHLGNFSDPLIENKVSGKRYRADHLIEEFDSDIVVQTMTNIEMRDFLVENIKEIDGDKTEWTDIKEFQLMFETKQGVTTDSKSTVYLRPETAQGIFVNFLNYSRATRAKLPFGVGQVGKSFRNEVTPGNFIFRTREFEQMELEYFDRPEHANESYKYYINKCMKFATGLGINEESLKFREHHAEELAHYAKGTTDIEFEFPFGWGELMGIANRGDFDLKQHSNHSGSKLIYRDPISNDVFTPYVIEPSIGLDRIMLAVLVDAYQKEKLENDERIVLKFDESIAPYKYAILPLNKKVHGETARKLFSKLVEKGMNVTYDEAGSIGKRYRRQDSIGTPYVITVIDETSTLEKVTIRFRDTMKQETIEIDEIS